MADQRGTYFTFQGLFMAVIILLFFFQSRGGPGQWGLPLAGWTLLLGSSLVGLRLVRREVLSSWTFQAAFFIGDALLATLAVHWRQQNSQVYLIYFLIIFGTALTRNYRQGFILGVGTSCLYLLVGWSPRLGFPHDTAFWLRFELLIITTILLAVLSRETQQAQTDQERRYQEHLIQIERLATLGQVAGEVAHRIKGPLTTIMVNAEVLAHRHGKSRTVVKELSEIQEEVRHCREILKNLLDLGRIEEMDVGLIDLREPVRLALKSAEAQLRKFGIRLETSGLDAPRMVLADQSLLQEAITAILQNSIDATRKGGRIGLLLRQSEPHWTNSEAPDSYLVIISDDGNGISVQDLERVFQPFFTTKGREGSGLGLSAALRIVQKHNGSIEAYSEGPTQGARFTVSLPRARRDRPA